MQVTRLITSDFRRILMRGAKYQDLRYEPLRAERRTVDCAPGLYVAEQLTRVVSCHPGRTLAGEVAKIEARSWTESPAMVCELSNASVLGGDIFTERERYSLGQSSPYRSLAQKAVSLDHAYLPNTRLGMTFFGHWLRDDCPVFELCSGKGRTVSLRRKNWADCAVYEKAFGHSWTELDSFRAKNLTLVHDIGFNLDKGARIQVLRSRLRDAYRERPGCIFIARGPSGRERGIANEKALLNSLAASGIRVVRPEHGDGNIIENCLGADVVITVEGSQAAHAAYLLREGGSLLILQPPDRFFNPHVEWTRLLGMNYGIVVGRQASDGMTIDPSEVLQMIERLMRLDGTVRET